MFRWCAFLIFVFSFASLHAQQDGSQASAPGDSSAAETTDTISAAPLVVQYDSSTIVARSAEASLQKFRNDDDFVYERKVSLDPSIWDQFMEWLSDLLTPSTPGSISLFFWVWRILPYVLVGAAVIYLIFRLSGTSFGGLFGKQGRRVVETEIIEENIHELDFDKLIDEAVKAQQYRKALRLLYLRSLKELSDGNHIHWSIDKTNREYLAELPANDLRRKFEQLTLLFEYIWYGDFPVDRPLFDRSLELFRNFSTMTTQHA